MFPLAVTSIAVRIMCLVAPKRNPSEAARSLDNEGGDGSIMPPHPTSRSFLNIPIIMGLHSSQEVWQTGRRVIYLRYVSSL